MSKTNDITNNVTRQELLEFIEKLKSESKIDEEFAKVRASLEGALDDLQYILSSKSLDLQRLDHYIFAIFRVVTDSGFQLTLLGQKYLEFDEMLVRFVKEIS